MPLADTTATSSALLLAIKLVAADTLSHDFPFRCAIASTLCDLQLARLGGLPRFLEGHEREIIGCRYSMHDEAKRLGGIVFDVVKLVELPKLDDDLLASCQLARTEGVEVTCFVD